MKPPKPRPGESRRHWLLTSVILVALCTPCLARTRAEVFCLPATTETGVLCGLILSGRVVRSPDLLTIGAFERGSTESSVAPAQDSGGRWGFIDGSGRWLSSPRFDMARTHSDEGLARVELDGKWGFADRTGEVVVGPSYPSARPFEHGLAAVQNRDGWSYIDTDGQTAISGPFDVALSFSPNGLAAVMPRGTDKFGYIDRSGNLVIPARYDEAGPFGDDGLAAAAVEKPVGDPEWEMTDTLDGLIDATGNWVLEPRYTSLQPTEEAALYSFLHLPPGESSREGFVDRAGREVITGDQLSRTVRCGLVRKGSHGRFLGLDGAAKIDESLDWVSHFNDSCRALGIDGSGVALFDTDGNLARLPGSREPLLDPFGALVEFWRPGGGLLHVLGSQPEILFFEAEGRRPTLRYRGSANTADGLTTYRLVGDDGSALWSSSSLPSNLQPRLQPPSATLLRDHREDAEDTVRWQQPIEAVLDELLRQPVRRFSSCSIFVFQSCADLYDLTQLASDWEPEDLARMVHFGAVELIASRYVDAGQWATYEFLDSQADEQFRSYFETWSERLQSVLGKPVDGDAGLRSLALGEGGSQATWRRGERYVVLAEDTWFGDGDFEHQLLLAVVDSRSVDVER